MSIMQQFEPYKPYKTHQDLRTHHAGVFGKLRAGIEFRDPIGDRDGRLARVDPGFVTAFRSELRPRRSRLLRSR